MEYGVVVSPAVDCSPELAEKELKPLFAGFDLDEYDYDGLELDFSLQLMDSNFVNKSLTLKVFLSSPLCDDNFMMGAV
ncbi:hypothetical protein LguiB_033158 [Lonicera macranthoides]